MLKRNCGHIRNKFGFCSKKLWSHQKWIWIPLKKNYGHVRNDVGFHSKKIMVMSEMNLDSAQKELLSCQKWIPDKKLWSRQKWFLSANLFKGKTALNSNSNADHPWIIPFSSKGPSSSQTLGCIGLVVMQCLVSFCTASCSVSSLKCEYSVLSTQSARYE